MIAATPLALAGDYTINISCSDGGSVTINRMSGTADADEEIKVFLHPDNDMWELESLSILRADNNEPIQYEPYHDPNYEAYSFKMPAADVDITVSFLRAFYSIEVLNPDGGFAETSVSKAATGDEVRVKITPFDGYRILGVFARTVFTSEDVTLNYVSDSVYTFTVGYDDVMIYPLFVSLPSIDIRRTDSENGDCSVEENGFEGEEIYVYTSPDRGYTTSEVTVTRFKSETDSAPIEVTKLSEDSYKFVLPACSWVTVSAAFEKKKYYVVNDENIEHGTVAEAQSDAFHYFDDEVTLHVTPDADYVLNHLYILDADGNEIMYNWQTENETLTFTMPYSDVTVYASFRYAVYDVEILESEHGTVTADIVAARVGDTVTLTVTPDVGCLLTSLKVLAGYEVKSGGGGVHAPHVSLKSEPMWFTQQEIYLNRIDDSHYSFVLPVSFFNDLAENYLESTKFRVLASFKDVGAQAIWCVDNNTLYFNYEAKPEYELKVGDRFEGQVVTALWFADDVLNTGWSTPKWAGVASSSATQVVFMPSFADATPMSTYAWFYNYHSLDTIVGIENLNTSRVVNTNSMFMGCIALKTLNLNTFDMSNVTNSTSMFRACSALTTIYCDSTWNIATSGDMFKGDTNLVGAVAYDGTKVDGSMANPNTGYFTSSLLITKSVNGNGTITAPERAFVNETVSFTVAAGRFTTLESVTVTGDVTGNAIDITLNAGVYTFTMPAEPVTITATFPAPPATLDAVLWCEGNSTMYFVSQPAENLVDGTWDGQEITAEWWGKDVTNVGWGIPKWNYLKETATRVVFDESFAAVRPLSCYGWFYRFGNLSTIEGLGNLNTSEVTNTNSMFLSCSKLTTLDVNTFDMSKVSNATGMFRECRSLATIYCNNTWNISTSSGMFFGDTCLVGAVPYDLTLITASMANPLTGYFTALNSITLTETSRGTLVSNYDEAYTNTEVTITVTPASERVFVRGLTITGNVTGNTISYKSGEHAREYTFVMPGESVTVTANFVQMDYTLSEALQEPEGTELRLVEPMYVAAKVGTHAYVTDGEGNWARLDLDETDRVVEGDLIAHFDGVLTNRDTAPTFVRQESGSISFSHMGVSVDLKKIDLAKEFEMPKPSEVIEVTGIYSNGELFGKSGGRGQSMTLATDFMQPEMTEGYRYRMLVAIELKEPWDNPSGAPRRPRSNYEFEYQNLKGQVISSLEEQITTGIDSIDAGNQIPHDGRRYNLMGQPVGPDYKGIVIENGRKFIVK